MPLGIDKRIDPAAAPYSLFFYPRTTQVAAQEGAYVARLLNRGYDLGVPVPTFPIDEGTYRII